MIRSLLKAFAIANVITTPARMVPPAENAS